MMWMHTYCLQLSCHFRVVILSTRHDEYGYLNYPFTCYDLYALLLYELWSLCTVSISGCFSVYEWLLPCISTRNCLLHLPIEDFNMTSQRPYWCPKTMKRQPCWRPKQILWESNSFLQQTLSFVLINWHRCQPRSINLWEIFKQAQWKSFRLVTIHHPKEFQW